MSNEVPVQDTKKRQQLVWGVVLVSVGVWMLVSNFTGWELGAALPLALGLFFLVWGSVNRKVGFLIPGGILMGIGAGVVLLEGPFNGLDSDLLWRTRRNQTQDSRRGIPSPGGLRGEPQIGD